MDFGKENRNIMLLLFITSGVINLLNILQKSK